VIDLQKMTSCNCERQHLRQGNWIHFNVRGCGMEFPRGAEEKGGQMESFIGALPIMGNVNVILVGPPFRCLRSTKCT